MHYKPGEDPEKPDTWSAETRIAKANAWAWDYAFVYLDGESTTGHYNYDVKHFYSPASSTGYPAKIMQGAVIQRVSGDVFSAKVLTEFGNTPNVLVLWHGSINQTRRLHRRLRRPRFRRHRRPHQLYRRPHQLHRRPCRPSGAGHNYLKSTFARIVLSNDRGSLGEPLWRVGNPGQEAG